MRALVTGATGFVGSHLVEALVARGVEVRCLVRPTSRTDHLHGLAVELCVAALDDQPALAAALSDVEVVYHVAGIIKALGADEYHRANALGTRAVAHACLRASPRPRRLVLVSSQAVGGPARPERPVREEDPPAPVSEYGRSKLEAEREALAIGDQVEIAIVRPSVVYGPRDAALAALFRLVSLGIAPRLRADPSISLIHARDLVRCVLLAADRPEARGRWFYAAGPAMRLSAITEAIGRAYGRRPLSLPVPGTLLLAAGLASDLAARVTRRPNAFSRRKAGEMLHSGWVCATDLALHELGFKAEIEIEDGFRETAAWYHRNNWR